jgi:hypothetical protein
MTPARLAQVAGVSRRSLQIHRRLSGGRLVVTVDVPPGGGTQRVRIGYAAIRGRHVAARGSRLATAHDGVARVAFPLTRSARRAGELRVTARQGSARATRSLLTHTRRRGSAQPHTKET